MQINKMECPLMYNCQLMKVDTNEDENNKCKYEEICEKLCTFDDETTTAYYIQAAVTNAINMIQSIVVD